MKQIRKSKSVLKRNTHAPYHLLAKPNDQAAKTAYRIACSILQAKLMTMQNDCWTALAERTQHYADMGDMRAFCELTESCL